ncbi:HAMP domain-containing histidine kinase [Pleurocapsales cyanobacterium LEGE 06147]|nr:HAMP domain-containing histidine kinase [Pleurocapsales cyanobacterium LEGE 06147]
MNEFEQLKEELKQTQLAYQMAAQMSQFKAGFLARTSHELRSPLNSLIGLHQLILSNLCESPEEEREFIAQAYQSALKLMQLIDEIVSVAKTEYGSNQLDLQSLQLADIFNQVYSLTHLQAANRNLTLTILPPDSSLYALADRARLVQLIVNLIDSGISAMKEGKIAVTASSSPDSDWIEIAIDCQCPATIWNERADTEDKIELIPQQNTVKQKSRNTKKEIQELIQEITLSPAMKLLLSQTLLETMGGHLEILELPSANKDEPRTRLLLSCQKSSRSQK